MELDIIRETDPQVAELVEKELSRQQKTIELIASENFTSKAVMAACGTVLTNKYAEGKPHKRFYNGCDNIDVIEELAQKHLGMSYADFDKEYHDELEFCKTVTYADFNSMSERQTFVYGKAKAYAKEMLKTTINEARNTRLNYGERLLDETNKTSDDLSIITTFELDGINDDSWTKLKSGIVINSFKDVLKKNFSENKPNGINDLIVKPLTRKTIKKIENGKVIVITQNGLKYNINGILK